MLPGLNGESTLRTLTREECLSYVHAGAIPAIVFMGRVAFDKQYFILFFKLQVKFFFKIFLRFLRFFKKIY